MIEQTNVYIDNNEAIVGMTQCLLCKASFFLIESLEEHNKWCIGYEPKEK